MSKATIGWLWAHGVIAEVFLFMVGRTLIEARGSGAYLAMAALSLGGSGIAYGMLRASPARG